MCARVNVAALVSESNESMKGMLQCHLTVGGAAERAMRKSPLAASLAPLGLSCVNTSFCSTAFLCARSMQCVTTHMMLT